MGDYRQQKRRHCDHRGRGMATNQGNQGRLQSPEAGKGKEWVLTRAPEGVWPC